MFDPVEERKGKRHAEPEGGRKVFKSAPTLEQEYEEGIEGVWNTPDSSSSSSSSFIVPTTSGKRTYQSYSGRNSWDDYVSKRVSNVVEEEPEVDEEFYPTYPVAAEDVRTLATLSNASAEIKHLTVAGTYYDATTSPTVTLLNGVATGSTNITRNGNVARFVSLQIRGQITPVDATTVRGRCDLYVILDASPAAAVPAVTDMLEAATPNSFTKYDNRARFTTLVHRYWVMPTIDDTKGIMGAQDIFGVEIYKKLDVCTYYKGTTNVIGDISRYALYLFVIGISDAAYNRFYLTTRLLFKE